MRLGVKETKEMLTFVLKLGNALGNALEDDKVGITDISDFVSPLMSAGDAFANAIEIPKELADLDEQEKTELLDYVKTTFDIPEKNIELVVESAFDLLAKLYDLVKVIKASLPKA